MSNAVQPIPDGYSAPVPMLIVDGGAAAIDFYKRAFGAKENGRMEGPGGKLMHADLTVGGGHIMLSDAFPDMGSKSPKGFGGSPVTICIYVANSDEVIKRAASAGGTITRPVQDEFWGDRAGQIRDPFGHNWYVLTHVENVSREEMEKRGAAMMAGTRA